jgi:2-oxo-4-hydroxy-4-carboxy-5-ureidoimidazoline decarboxylase
MSLAQLNSLDKEQAQQAFLQCCTAMAWVNNMVASRPYANEEALRGTANIHWQGLSEQDYLQAFEGHPQIGDVNTLRARYANIKALAGDEQGAVSEASDAVLEALSQANQAYLDKFGFIFIVCATGKSAAQMLALLQARLPNDRHSELSNAAQEQQKIFHLRLEKLL